MAFSIRCSWLKLLVAAGSLTLGTLPLHARTPEAVKKESIQPEVSAFYEEHPVATGRRFMASTPHPLATEAAYWVLQNGGNAVDAAIAAGAMLTLVEPHASGIGGGGFMLYYNAASRKTVFYDGRETAPLSARPTMFLDAKGQPQEFYSAVGGGKSVGVPGLVAMFELAHQQHGKMRWYNLWRLSAEQAKAGFRVEKQLARLIADDILLPKFPVARRYFSDASGRPLPAGSLLKNPALAETLSNIGINGSRAFYADLPSDAMLEAIRKSPVNPGGMGMQDLIDYKAVTRAALCGTYRQYTLCGAPPPSAGGLVTLQVLKMLERFPLGKTPAFNAEAIHLFTEASRMAYADRNAYIADPSFSPAGVNATAMLNPAYVQARSKLIQANRSLGITAPGTLPGQKAALAISRQTEPPSTSHISIVDGAGNAVALTQSIENIFGSRLMAAGFLLNNQLTDFSFLPSENGKPVANAAAPGKRPRSSMSPTMVFETKTGKLRYVLGSPGGARITPYVLKTLLGVLDWNMPLDAAVKAGNIANRNSETELEENHFKPEVAADLRKRGQTVIISNLSSAVNAIEIKPDGQLVGVADPRRGGRAKGE